VPCGVDIRVQVLLGRLAARHTVTRVVVAEYVAIDARAQSQVKTRHLAKVNSVAVREQNGKARGRRAADEQARDPVAARSPRVEALHRLLFALGVLPLGTLRQRDGELGALVFDERVRGFGR